MSNLQRIDMLQYIEALRIDILQYIEAHQYIEALNILNQQTFIRPFEAIILGSAQGRNVYYKKLLTLVEKYRLNQKVKFISHCKEMPLAYKLADVVVSSSIEPEAFGRVSVEAQAMEKPIIASEIGGSKETIIKDKSGLLFKSGDPMALADKLKEVFVDLLVKEFYLKLLYMVENCLLIYLENHLEK